MQNLFSPLITAAISSQLNTEVNIGEINFRPINSLLIDDLLIKDQKNDTLVFIEQTKLNFDLSKIFKGEIIFNDVTIKDLNGSIHQYADKSSNLDFIINTFKKDSTEKDSKIKFAFEDIKIINSKLKYRSDKLDSLGNANSKLFEITKLNAQTELTQISKDSFLLNLKKLNLTEKNGLELKNLKFKSILSSNKILVSELIVQLENSELRFGNIELHSHDKFKTLSETKMLALFNAKRITPADFKSLIPQLAQFHDGINLKGRIEGKISNFKLRDFSVRYGKNTQFSAELDLNGLPNLNETFIFGDVRGMKTNSIDLQDFLSQLQGKPYRLPESIKRLRNFRYQGKITGFISNIVAYGVLSTDAGSISTDILLLAEENFQKTSFQGSIKTSNFKLGKVLNNNKLDNISFNISSKGSNKTGKLKGSVRGLVSNLWFKGYSYKDIELDGKFSEDDFDGNVSLKDEHIEADFNGKVDFSNPQYPIFNFGLIVNKIQLHELNLIDSYADSQLSFELSTDLTGKNLDNINGTLKISDIHFVYKNKTLNAGDLTFISDSDPTNTHFSIQSDYLNGTVSGNFKYSKLGGLFNDIAGKFFPSINTSSSNAKGNLNIDLTLDQTAEISSVLELGSTLNGQSRLTGSLDNFKNNYKLNLKVPEFLSGISKYENLNLSLDNKKSVLNLSARMQVTNTRKKSLVNWYTINSASGDSISTQLGWQNTSNVTVAGEVQTTTRFKRLANNKLKVNLNVLPTQIIMSDSVWDIRSSQFVWIPDSSLEIKNFRFESERQFININGKASKSVNDNMHVSMKNLDLQYIMSMLNLRAIRIGGSITGDLNLISMLKEPIIISDLEVKNVTLNNALVGDAVLESNWDKNTRHVVIKGNFTKNQGKEQVSEVSGYYAPRSDSLNLTFDATDFNLAFLNRYFEGVVSDFKGSANGKIHLYGPTKDILFEADAFVKNGGFKMDMLQTKYSFNDSIHLTPYQIRLDKIRLFDEDGNPALANGFINHNGSFSDMKYDANIRGDNIMAMNTNAFHDEFFYGKAYIGGNVHIFGNDDECNIIAEGATRPNTKCYMSMGTASTVSDNNFVRFVPRNYVYLNNQGSQQDNNNEAEESDFNVKTDMRIEITPDAEIEIIVDPRAGDVITGRGRGDLRIQFDTFSDVNMYGTVDIDYGYYLFTLQTVIRKEFRIDQGSSISWSGNPYYAQVNINGHYPLTASLSDLMEPEELAQVTTRSSVPVNCVLYLTDQLMSPSIKFDIDLPSSDESVKQRVKNIINTEEMMNRQILYLLLLNKFYTPDYLRSSPLLGVNEGISFATATVSSQINSWIQHALNSNIFSFGVDWQKSELVNDEVKANILIQPNNRLIINGNIGYRNNNVTTNTNKFIGDFDVEYKLLESGQVRLNAYNHTIDRAQLREAKTTQGVGILYREDFDSFAEMLKYYWNVFTFKKK